MRLRMQCDYIKKPKHSLQIKVQEENLLMLGVGDLLLEVGSFFYQRLFCILII